MFEALLEIFEIHSLGSLQISLLAVLPELFLFLAMSQKFNSQTIYI